MTEKPLRVSVVGTVAHARLGRGLARWLAGHAPRSARGEVTIALVSDARMRGFNRRFRGVDGPTDVLSFPPGPWPLIPGPRVLGDMVIAVGTARRQANEAGHSVSTELRLLALHGLLHLLGYDHERDVGTMARVERRLRRRAGLPVGLLERGRAT